MSSDVLNEFISMKRTLLLNVFRISITCLAVRSRKLSSPLTGSSDFALSSPMEVPSPPLSFRTTVCGRYCSPPLHNSLSFRHHYLPISRGRLACGDTPKLPATIRTLRLVQHFEVDFPVSSVILSALFVLHISTVLSCTMVLENSYGHTVYIITSRYAPDLTNPWSQTSDIALIHRDTTAMTRETPVLLRKALFYRLTRLYDQQFDGFSSAPSGVSHFFSDHDSRVACFFQTDFEDSALQACWTCRKMEHKYRHCFLQRASATKKHFLPSLSDDSHSRCFPFDVALEVWQAGGRVDGGFFDHSGGSRGLHNRIRGGNIPGNKDESP